MAVTVRQKAIDPFKVAIYIRWSTEDQAEGTSLDVQTEGCRHYVLSQGWTVQDELTFIDDGYSGGNLERPALGRLRQAVQDGAVDCVVVFKLDRLSRDVADIVRLVMDEWDGRCHIKSAREPIDTTTQAGKMFFYTLASFAEWERSVIKDRTFSGKLRRAMEGKNPGFTPPYGYQRGEGAVPFAAVPHEAETVRRIYLLYRQGYGARAIAGLLNEGGSTFRGGRPWNQTTIKNILRNPAYTGRLVYGATVRDARRQRRSRAAQPHLVREGVFPVIIPQSEWDLVQAAKRERPGPGSGGSARSHASPHLLSGLLRCGGCGQAMGGTAGLSHRIRYRYYVCVGVQTRGACTCPSRRIQQQVLDDLVVGHLRQLYAGDGARERYLRLLAEATDAELAGGRATLAEVEGALGQLNDKRRTIRSLVLDKQLTVKEYRELLAHVEAEERGLADRRKRLQETLQTLAATRAQHARLAQGFDDLDRWESLDITQRKALLRRFIVEINAFLPRDGQELTCNITWRVPMDKPTEVVRYALPRLRARSGQHHTAHAGGG